MNGKLLLFVGFFFVAVLMLILVNIGISGSKDEVPEEIAKELNASEVEEDQFYHPQKEMDVYETKVGKLTDEQWPDSSDMFTLLWGNDMELEKYFLEPRDKPSVLYIIPNQTKYDIEITEVKLKNKKVTIKYKNGKTKIPRLVGHQQVFDIEAYTVNFINEPETIYSFEIINDDNKMVYEEEKELIKNVNKITWQVRNLTWGEDNQLVFSSDRKRYWGLWSYNLIDDDKAQEMTDRHKDIPLNQLPSLGTKNINVQKPFYNSYTDRIVYHSEHDIFEVKTDGNRNIPLTVKNTYVPSREGLNHFDFYPKSSSEGKTILFTRLYDPMKTELWSMSFKGNDRKKYLLPMDGFIEDYDWSPEDDQIAVVISKRNSELTNGKSNLFILDPDRKGETKRISTGGYHIESIDFSSDNKSIVFSLQLNQATDNNLTDIWKVNSNNTDLMRLTPKDRYKDIHPVWSPNGDNIAFISGIDGDYFLSVMDKNGEGRRILDRNIKVVDYPLWSKDNKSIYISDKYGAIYHFNLENNTIVEVLEGGYNPEGYDDYYKELPVTEK